MTFGGWFFNPWALVGYALVLAAWSLASFLLFVKHPTRQTRTLAWLLIAEGFIGAGGFAFIWSTTSARAAFAWQIVSMCAAILAAALYIGFISTLGTPLGRPFRDARVRFALFGAVGLLVAYLTLNPQLLVAGMFRVWWDAWEPTPGPAWDAVWRTTAIVSIFGLVAAWDARRRTRMGTEARRRATFYLAAFGVRDVAWAALFLTSPLWFHRAGAFSDAFILAIVPGSSLAFCFLLVYGILRARLFDIDLKIKWTVRRGTLVTIFLFAFFMVTAITEQYLQRYGTIAGGAAVGLLLFALRPLERAADRFANVAMPEVQDTEEYRAVRKREVYRAAYERAAEDGQVTDKDRGVLATVASELGLSPLDVLDIERIAVPLPTRRRGP